MKAWTLAVLLLAAVLAEKALARPGSAVEEDEDADDLEAQGDAPAEEGEGGATAGLAPKLLSSPLLLTPKPGDTVWLPCNVENVPTVVWLNGTVKPPATLAVNGLRLTFKDDDRLTFHTNHTLEIRNVQSRDSGAYTCKINDALQVHHTIELFEPPRLLSVEPEQPQVIAERDQNVKMRCHFAGNPPPHIYWTRKVWTEGQGNHLSGDPKFHKGDHLHLAHVDARHSGIYTCWATNGLGNASHSFHLGVKDGPQNVPERDMVNTNIGARPELACVVHAYPTASVVWSFSTEPEKPLRSSAHMRILEEDVPGEAGLSRRYVLRFEDVTEEQLGTYYCLASNDHGTSRRAIKLSGAPAAAKLDHVTYKKGRPVLSWTVESLDPITKYELMYRPKDSSDWASVELPAKKHEGNIYTVTYELEDTKAPEYEAKLKSRNSFGWSDDSQKYPFAADTSKRAEPSRDGEPRNGAPVTRLSFSLLLGAVVLLLTRS